MKYILAISGGVDSVVLLDMVVRGHFFDLSGASSQLVVAHIDHGIRDDSGDDRRFVAGLARSYGLEFVSTELKLGKNASEDLARARRYEFLFAEAKKHQATILTAHHADDLAGSVAINLHRGTGWRGLAVLARTGIERPLSALRKADIYRYALDHHLEWVEDSTNADLTILRNSLRGQVFSLPDQKVACIVKLRDKQVQLASEITAELDRLNQLFTGRRYPYTMIEPKIAVELLRRYVEVTVGAKPTRIEAKRMLLAIKLNQPDTTLQLTASCDVIFRRQSFIVQAGVR